MNQLQHEVKRRYAKWRDSDTRKKWYRIIFYANTPAGKRFDVYLLIFILLSVVLVLLETVPSIGRRYYEIFYALEWLVTITFTIEYMLRVATAANPRKYATSFFGIVDLLAILPTYLSLIIAGSQALIVIRTIRLLRVFRILKMIQYVKEAELLGRALLNSKQKIVVFFSSVLALVTVLGAIMFMVEGPENGYTSIPIGIYWTITTLTTVGFGDITPLTNLGKAIASFIMLLGYSIIAVPTGILGAQLVKEIDRSRLNYDCQACGLDDHDVDARFCRRCGSKMNMDEQEEKPEVNPSLGG